MTKVETILNLIGHYKYLITIVVGVAVIGVFSDNSFINLMELNMKKTDLQEEIAKFKKQNAESANELRVLKHNKDMIEKVARERYFMKKDDEDIFVISTDVE